MGTCCRRVTERGRDLERPQAQVGLRQRHQGANGISGRKGSIGPHRRGEPRRAARRLPEEVDRTNRVIADCRFTNRQPSGYRRQLGRRVRVVLPRVRTSACALRRIARPGEQNTLVAAAQDGCRLVEGVRRPLVVARFPQGGAEQDQPVGIRHAAGEALLEDGLGPGRASKRQLHLRESQQVPARGRPVRGAGTQRWSRVPRVHRVDSGCQGHLRRYRRGSTHHGRQRQRDDALHHGP